MPHISNLARVLRADMEAARAAWLEREGAADDDSDPDFLEAHDSDGRTVDFHALRHTFISSLARAGVTPKLAQDLARHSDINLTLSHYTHTVIGERASAVDAMPELGEDKCVAHCCAPRASTRRKVPTNAA